MSFEPTAHQLEIRDFRGPSLLILAPAGCGKTEALALRVKGLIDQGATRPPQKILLVTFTNRSKENLEQRLFAHLSPHELRTHVQVNNLHGLASRIIRAHGESIGLDSDWAIPSSDWVGEQCRERKLKFAQSSIVRDHLQKAKLATRTDAEVAKYLEATQHPTAIEIEGLRVSEKQLTYDDLPRLADLILRNSTIADLYAEHFSAVIIDEFQDLTLQQLSMVSSFGTGRTTFAGDMAQGIYMFAGADPSAVLAAAMSQNPGQITFAESHRSSPAVLDVVNALDPLTGGFELSSSRPNSWPGGGLATHKEFQNNEAEANWILNFARVIQGKAPKQRVGVMARTKARRAALDSALTDTSDLQWFRWDDPLFDSHSAPLLRSLLRRATQHDLQQPDVEYLLLAQVDLVELQDPSTFESIRAGVAWIAELSRNGLLKKEILARVKTQENVTLIDAPGLHVLTGHAGKGQQFDWVIIVGLERDSIPGYQATTQALLEEEARVLSVMLSRARHGVITTRSATAVKPWGDIVETSSSQFEKYINASPSRLSWDDAKKWLQDADWEAIAKR